MNKELTRWERLQPYLLMALALAFLLAGLLFPWVYGYLSGRP